MGMGLGNEYRIGTTVVYDILATLENVQRPHN